MVLRAQVRFTYDLLKSTPDDGKRYEILDGELYVTPAPNRRHQRLSKWIQHFLFQHVELEERLGEIYDAPFDVILAEDQVVQPDLLFVKRQRASLLSDRGLEGAPDLVVEILSPKTRDRDLTLKRAVYGRFGVAEVWFVDPDLDRVAVWTLREAGYQLVGDFSAGDRLESLVLPGLLIDLQKVFER
jgi:Uma2 family endonuclease